MKLLAPDFFIGRTLVMSRSLLDSAWLLIRHPNRRSLRFVRLIYRVKPRYTMVTNNNLIHLYTLVAEANQLNLPGDLVECGVWNGGSAAVMGKALAEHKPHGHDRAIWCFDSFEGLPHPGQHDGQAEKDAYFKGWNMGSVDKVKEAFTKLNLGLTNVNIVPGWFEETLAKAPIETIAVLHIDADWYDSVKLVLDVFYDKVTLGGFIVLDDYGYWQGCTQAVKDFFAQRGINDVEIRRADRVGAYFQKIGRVTS
jgi:O-methyltransferase